MSQAFPAPAKLNLFLHVTGRRADGYHLLESVFALVDYGDTITIKVRADGVITRLNDVAGVPAESDLAIRAARLLQAESRVQAGADLSIAKRIPMGGGLGGGSSDAATVLLALNRLWNLGLPRARLMALGLTLGADVPFFVFGQSAFAQGVGEALVPLELPELWYVVLAPQANVPTSEIFGFPELTRNAKPVKMADFSVGDLVGEKRGGKRGAKMPIRMFPEAAFRNHLETVVVGKYPVVREALDWLKGHGGNAAISARMTGSGACVFAALESRQAAEALFAQRPDGVEGFVASGLKRHPLHDFAR